jgi:hypothetical protein
MLNKEIKSHLSSNLNSQLEVINRRIDEMFEHSVEGTASDQELINTINSIRFGRFDKTLNEAMTVITHNLKSIHEMGVPLNAHHHQQQLLSNQQPIEQTHQQQQPSQHPSQDPRSAHSASQSQGRPPNAVNNQPTNTNVNQNLSNSRAPSTTGNPPNQNHANNPATQQRSYSQAVVAQPPNQQNVASAPVVNNPNQSAAAQAIAKEELKSYITDILGNAYMSIHALDYDTFFHIDEAIAVLSSYWRINEKRINEEIHSILDMILLQQCSENIEKDLLLHVQLFLADNKVLQNLFLEDPEITKKRDEYTSLKTKIDRLLIDIEKLIPNCPAKIE